MEGKAGVREKTGGKEGAEAGEEGRDAMSWRCIVNK